MRPNRNSAILRNRATQKRDRKLPTDKWIIGMVDPADTLRMFANPKVHTDYASAVKEAERLYHCHGKPFIVFAKKCVIGPTRPPVLKTEYLA